MDKNIQGVERVATNELFQSKNKSVNKVNGESFGDILKKSIGEVNEIQKAGEKAMEDIATGQVKDLHQAAIAIDKAEMNMKLMLEVRNKAINAYKEILRTQI